jgi:hypothetical protein
MTLPQTTTDRKPPKAFYAHLYDEAGTLAKVDGGIYFMPSDTDILTAIEPEMCPFLMVLGEIGLADTQKLMDELHGNLARIATSRQNLEGA